MKTQAPHRILLCTGWVLQREYTHDNSGNIVRTFKQLFSINVLVSYKLAAEDWLPLSAPPIKRGSEIDSWRKFTHPKLDEHRTVVNMSSQSFDTTTTTATLETGLNFAVTLTHRRYCSWSWSFLCRSLIRHCRRNRVRNGVHFEEGTSTEIHLHQKRKSSPERTPGWEGYLHGISRKGEANIILVSSDSSNKVNTSRRPHLRDHQPQPNKTRGKNKSTVLSNSLPCKSKLRNLFRKTPEHPPSTAFQKYTIPMLPCDPQSVLQAPWPTRLPDAYTW
jgi:hypothetical protein